jgi:hypothetical protein
VIRRVFHKASARQDRPTPAIQTNAVSVTRMTWAATSGYRWVDIGIPAAPAIADAFSQPVTPPMRIHLALSPSKGSSRGLASKVHAV